MAHVGEMELSKQNDDIQDTPVKIPEKNISSIKNKQRRNALYMEMKRAKKKAKLKEKKRKKQDAEASGKEVPKQVPKTLENTRVYDETMVNIQDEEVMEDEEQDEFATYFNRDTTPKILITTSDRPGTRTRVFCKELRKILPNSYVLYRRAIEVKKIVTQCKEKEFTDIIIVNEDQKKPNGFLLVHLPDGPTAHFKLSGVKIGKKEIRNLGRTSNHYPEVILNNFNTRLGHSVGRMLASLFPHNPQFSGRRVVTFHNQRDFIFVRHHRYQFRNKEKVGLQQLGPKFTLKLRSLQKGTFDSKFGEYEWVHKRHEMETSRRKFFL